MSANGDVSNSFMQMLRGALEAVDGRLRSVENAITEQKQRLTGIVELSCTKHDKQMEELFASRNGFNIVIETIRQEITVLKEARLLQQGKSKDYTLLIWGAALGLMSTVVGGLVIYYVTKT